MSAGEVHWCPPAGAGMSSSSCDCRRSHDRRKGQDSEDCILPRQSSPRQYSALGPDSIAASRNVTKSRHQLRGGVLFPKYIAKTFLLMGEVRMTLSTGQRPGTVSALATRSQHSRARRASHSEYTCSLRGASLKDATKRLSSSSTSDSEF
jgi:hypothetical protein